MIDFNDYFVATFKIPVDFERDFTKIYSHPSSVLGFRAYISGHEQFFSVGVTCNITLIENHVDLSQYTNLEIDRSKKATNTVYLYDMEEPLNYTSRILYLSDYEVNMFSELITKGFSYPDHEALLICKKSDTNISEFIKNCADTFYEQCKNTFTKDFYIKTKDNSFKTITFPYFLQKITHNFNKTLEPSYDLIRLLESTSDISSLDLKEYQNANLKGQDFLVLKKILLDCELHRLNKSLNSILIKNNLEANINKI